MLETRSCWMGYSHRLAKYASLPPPTQHKLLLLRQSQTDFPHGTATQARAMRSRLSRGMITRSFGDGDVTISIADTTITITIGITDHTITSSLCSVSTFVAR